MSTTTPNKYTGPLAALGSAFLFGACTPAIKLLIGQANPQLLAGLLYLGSGLGLAICMILSAKKITPNQEVWLKKADLPWLSGSIIFGGIVGPILLMLGLANTFASTASLLLNAEVVFTALIAWFAFKENFDRRIFLGMISIVIACIFLAEKPGVFEISWGSISILAACLCWALDNNLTRNIANSDPMQITSIKGTVSGVVNIGIALATGSALPSFKIIGAAALIGFCGYGISLVLFIRALRYLGTARSSAYFSTAPFVGASISLLIFKDALTLNLLLAAVFMGLGIWLHLTEDHVHEHSHAEEEHEHLHWHDEHHQHGHEHDLAVTEPHSHWHKHEAILHSHPHYPDSHHRHEH